MNEWITTWKVQNLLQWIRTHILHIKSSELDLACAQKTYETFELFRNFFLTLKAEIFFSTQTKKTLNLLIQTQSLNFINFKNKTLPNN